MLQVSPLRTWIISLRRRPTHPGFSLPTHRIGGPSMASTRRVTYVESTRKSFRQFAYNFPSLAHNRSKSETAHSLFPDPATDHRHGAPTPLFAPEKFAVFHRRLAHFSAARHLVCERTRQSPLQIIPPPLASAINSKPFSVLRREERSCGGL